MVWGEDFIPNVYLNGLEQSGIDRLGEDFIRTLKWVDAINQVNVKVINVDEFVSNIQKFLCPIRNTVSIIVIFLLFWRTAHDFKFGSKLAEQPAVGMHSKLRLSNAINGRDFVHVEVGEELHDDFRHLDISHEFWIVRLGDDCVDDFQGIQEGCDHLINTAGGENFLDTLGYGMFHIIQDDVAGLKRFTGPHEGTQYEGDVESQHLTHEQRQRDGLEHVVNGILDVFVFRIGLGDKIDKLGVLLSFAVTGCPADALHNFRQGRTVADGQHMFAPRPVKDFLGHAERNDDAHLVALPDLTQILEDIHTHGVIGYEVGNTQFFPLAFFHRHDACPGILCHHGHDGIQNSIHFMELLPCGFHGVDVGDMDNGFLV